MAIPQSAIDQARALYTNNLGRAGDEEGINYWAGRIASGDTGSINNEFRASAKSVYEDFAKTGQHKYGDLLAGDFQDVGQIGGGNAKAGLAQKQREFVYGKQAPALPPLAPQPMAFQPAQPAAAQFTPAAAPPPSNPFQYDQKNPYLDQMSEAITGDVTDNLKRNILPGISSAAMQVGGFGGSRQGVVEANALNDANKGLSNAITSMRSGDYNNTMQRQLQKYTQDQNYNLGMGNLDLGNRNSANSFSLGQGNLALANKSADQGFSLGLGNLALGQQNSDNSFSLGQGNLALGNLNANNNFALGNLNANNNFALGMGNLGANLQNANNNFYTAQRGQDLQQVGLGASLFGQANAGMLNQGQGIFNLGLTSQQAPWQSMQNFGNVAQPFTGVASTTNTQQGSSGAGFLGGAVAGSQLYNIYNQPNPVTGGGQGYGSSVFQP